MEEKLAGNLLSVSEGVSKQLADIETTQAEKINGIVTNVMTEQQNKEGSVKSEVEHLVTNVNDMSAKFAEIAVEKETEKELLKEKIESLKEENLKTVMEAR